MWKHAHAPRRRKTLEYKFSRSFSLPCGVNRDSWRGVVRTFSAAVNAEGICAVSLRHHLDSAGGAVGAVGVSGAASPSQLLSLSHSLSLSPS